MGSKQDYGKQLIGRVKFNHVIRGAELYNLEGLSVMPL